MWLIGRDMVDRSRDELLSRPRWPGQCNSVRAERAKSRNKVIFLTLTQNGFSRA